MYSSNIERLGVGDSIGVRHAVDGTLHLVINGEDMGPAVTSIPRVGYT